MMELIAVAIVTGVFGIVNTWQNAKLRRSTKTNHGKSIGEHVEKISDEQDRIKAGAADIALALLRSEAAQAEDRRLAREDRKLMAEHIAADAEFQAKVEPFLTGTP